VEEHTLRIAGSDTMRPLAARWADAFMTRNPGTSVQVEAGGSTSGIRALIDGRTALATASRTLFPQEVSELARAHGTVGLSVRCARDGVSIYLHPTNPVRDIGLPTLKAIFTGRLGTWREVGGLPDAEVRVVIRPPSSGTHGLVRSLLLHEEPYSERATVLATTEAVVAAVRGDPGAVGFGGMAFGQDLVHASIDGVAPTPGNVHSGAYSLSRYLYLHAVRPPRGIARRFVEFVLSGEGQRLVAEVGFVPLWDPDELPRAPGRPEKEGRTDGSDGAGGQGQQPGGRAKDGR